MLIALVLLLFFCIITLIVALGLLRRGDPLQDEPRDVE